MLLTGCAELENIETIQQDTGQNHNQTKVIQSQQEPLASEVEQEVSENEKPESNFIPAKVTRVVDGDTLKVVFDGKEETVRLLLVDTPETVHRNKPVQPFGPEASQFAKDTLDGKNVELEIDVGERDKYGRLLVYLHVDGQMFNKMLLEKGYARVAYVYAPNTKHVDEFYQIQKATQKQAIGIWSIENYATEDTGFKEEVVSEETKNEQSRDPQSNNCTIKGNINSRGEKIYHTTDSPWYEVTKQEEMFCSEEDARKAGFREIK